MHTITFFPLGNADTCMVHLESGRIMLFDYAATRNPDDEWDRRIDLPRTLRERLDAINRKDFDVVAFTHLDFDHICGASQFFHLEHSTKFQGGDRVAIKEIWVPAAAITETRDDLCAEAKIIQTEARYRFLKGAGVRVFSRPDALKSWLEEHGLTVAQRAQLITDAGTLVPGFSKLADGVEFFVHSPFAHRQDGELVDRNSCSLVFQATFTEGGVDTQVILAADSPHDVLSEIVNTTRAHSNESRLRWDVIKLPHHCSYLSLGPDKGREVTEPVPEVASLFSELSNEKWLIVSPSDQIPAEDTDQPPHVQAANYYRRLADQLDGQFIVTMEHPSKSAPAPLVIQIDNLGATPQKRAVPSATVATQRPAPRAG